MLTSVIVVAAVVSAAAVLLVDAPHAPLAPTRPVESAARAAEPVELSPPLPPGAARAEPAAPPAPPTPTTLPRIEPAAASGTLPPPTFLLVTPVDDYGSAPLRSVTLQGRFRFSYEQFGQRVLAFSPAPGTLTSWKLFTVMLYDRDVPAGHDRTRLDALLEDLSEGAAVSVRIPVLPDPDGESHFITSTVSTGGISEEEARGKYERVLLSNREPLLGLGVGSYFVTAARAISLHAPPSG